MVHNVVNASRQTLSRRLHRKASLFHTPHQTVLRVSVHVYTRSERCGRRVFRISVRERRRRRRGSSTARGHHTKRSREGAVDDRDEDDEQAEDVRQVVDLRRNLRGDGRHGRRQARQAQRVHTVAAPPYVRGHSDGCRDDGRGGGRGRRRGRSGRGGRGGRSGRSGCGGRNDWLRHGKKGGGTEGGVPGPRAAAPPPKAPPAGA